MRFEDLPFDATDAIVSQLDAKTRCRLACASRHARDCVHRVLVSVDLARSAPCSAAAFLMAAAPRIESLRCSSKAACAAFFRRARSPPRAAAFSALKNLRLSGLHVPARALSAMPDGLRVMRVHKLCDADCVCTSALDRLIAGGLRSANLWLADDVDTLCIDHERDGLETLILHAPRAHARVAGAPPAPSRLLAVRAMTLDADRGAALTPATTTRVRTTEWPPASELFGAACRHVRALSFECPSRHWLPGLAAFEGLERLRLRLDMCVASLRDFGNMRALKSVEIGAKYGISFDHESFRGFARDVALSVFVGRFRVDVSDLYA